MLRRTKIPLLFLVLVTFSLSYSGCAGSSEPQRIFPLSDNQECHDWQDTQPDWIWCDDFEDDTPLAEKYYDFDDEDGDITRTQTDAANGQYSLSATWQRGEDDAGHFMRTFGRNPVNSQSHSNEDFQEIYWRYYFKMEDGFQGIPDKFSRAFIFASPDWAQAMIGHVWLDEEWRSKLLLDPATGIDRESELASTKWNDFDNLRWLGNKRGSTALEPGRWYCLEAHVALNSPGQADGIFEFWLDDELEARRGDLDWVGSWNDYGLNSLSIENYWNAGSPKEQRRFFDALVISRDRIGCLSAPATEG